MEEKKSEDIGLVVGTKEEALWTKIRDEAKVLIEQSKDNLIIQTAMLKLAEEKIKEEKRKA